MKRFLAFALCAILLVCAFTLFASAEENPAVDETPVVEETPIVEAPIVEAPIAEEPPVEEPTLTETIVGYVKEHFEEISVVVTLLLTIFYNARKHGLLNTSIGTLNNNSVSIAQNALAEVTRVSSIVGEYTEKIESFLAECRANAEDKEKLVGMLAKADAFIESAKMANKELADEVASLLVLANIPTSVKDELMSKHIAAVHAIEAVEKTEVIHHDGEEA